MFALARIVSAAGLQLRIPGLAPVSARWYASKGKTNTLKAKEKSKLRRQRVNKPDKPAQAKRDARASKL
ncbi:hypothetical protein IWQ56_007161 [Coemansia nantahalensis]|nr:hypothetical protein IWQ56_007161 [Coemansia nantahalensis]